MADPVGFAGSRRRCGRAVRRHAAPCASGRAPPVSAPAAPAAVVPEGMVLVPAGEFLFGKDKRPATLPAYYIDRTEVSNAAYAKFAAATGRAAPTGKPEFPVVNITIQDARDYAAWAQQKLPTSQQWEKAARGTAGLLYPWGDKPDASRANLLSREGRNP